MFNEYFISIPVKSMPKKEEYKRLDSSEEDPVSSIIKKYRSNPSIKFTEKTKKSSQIFNMSTNILKKLFSPISSVMT